MDYFYFVLAKNFNENVIRSILKKIYELVIAYTFNMSEITEAQQKTTCHALNVIKANNKDTKMTSII